MYGLMKKIFIGLLSGIVSAFNHKKCVFLRNQKCMIEPTFISLHPSEYSQELHYYPFTVKSEKCVKVGVPNKTEDSNLSEFNMITEINESKTLTKHTLCKCKSMLH